MNLSSLLTSPLLAQAGNSSSDADIEAAATGCFACGSGLVFIFICVAVFNIALLVWVARDAKSRGMDSSVIWMLLVFFTSLFGLVIYILSRPQGIKRRCLTCGNSRLVASAKCPHCGNS